MPTRFELANAIRALSFDAVQKANSGHPGMPMGMADIAEVLWNDFLSHNPNHPQWADRDRFVLSNGHGSMLHYALLHLSGYDLPIEQLQQFRQLHSKTPGHPEYGITPGIETTTGPLGQGLANGVGMALAEKILAATFNRDGFPIVDHFTYVFAGDGCLMEGISHEVCSLAGTLGLGKLIVFYDDNGISIDGHVEGWFTDDTPKRFEAYGWHVVPDVDGHDPQSIQDAIQAAKSDRERPSLLCCKTIIGFGSPSKAGTHDVHGAPLGDKEIAAVREKLGWPHPPFAIPQDFYEAWDARERGHQAEAAWNDLFARYAEAYPALAADLKRRMQGDLPADWKATSEAIVESFQAKGATVASRKASQMALEAFGPKLPELLGGSADLTGSNLTMWSGSKPIKRTHADGNYIYYGVREFGMSGMMNGLALHGGLIPYGGTFLVFSDYARNALRLAALMQIRSIFVYTHDSIGLGEDGPTHQPIEHLASLDLLPGLRVWRPCDAVETAVAWKLSIEARGPSALALSRQNLPHQARTPEALRSIERGAYILRDSLGKPDLIFLATGSEIGLCVQAAEDLTKAGYQIRVVSVPCLTLFEQQDLSWRESVLPSEIQTRIAVEVASPERWRRLVGSQGRVLGIQRFGESAPGDTLMRFFGFTAKHVVEAAETLLRSEKTEKPASSPS